MAVNGRSKGVAFERQVAREIKAATGKECNRLIEQYRRCNLPGDLEGEAVAGYAIECKRYTKVQPAMLAKWRAQALRQGVDNGMEPVLVYKADRQPIMVNRWSGTDVYEQPWLDFLAELRQNHI